MTTSEAMRRLTSYYQHSQCHINAQQKVDEMARLVSASCSILLDRSLATFQHNTTDGGSSQKGTVLDPGGGSQASFLMQAFTLTKRSFVNMSRDFGYYWLRLIIYIVVTLCIGTIYLNVGTGYSSILVINTQHLSSSFVGFVGH